MEAKLIIAHIDIVQPDNESVTEHTADISVSGLLPACLPSLPQGHYWLHCPESLIMAQTLVKQK